MEGVDVYIIAGESRNKAFQNAAIVEQVENNVRCVTATGSEGILKNCYIVVLDLTKNEALIQKM